MAMTYTLCDVLRKIASERASQIAIKDAFEGISYASFVGQSEAVALHLLERKMCRGDRVAIYLPRSIDSAAVLFGVWFAGGVAVVINDVLKAPQIAHILEDADATLVVTNSSLAANLPPRKSRNSVVSVDEVKEDRREGCMPNSPISSDLAMLVYTSGSTGMPKGIILSHANLFSGAQIVSDFLNLSGSDVIISLLPFSFDYGLNQLLSSIFSGATLAIPRSILPADICQTVSRENVTGMAAVPMLWQQLCHPRSPFLKTKFPSLRYITNTGGQMPEQLTRQIRECHPQVEIYLMFGLTEAFRSTYLPPEQAVLRPTSIGKAIPNVEILVLNSEGKQCKPGEIGELVHRGANISLGYWRQPEATRRVFRRNPLSRPSELIGETVVFSGDNVKTDEEGFLYYVGRKDSQMKSHGMRVSPEEVEEYLLRSRALAHAVVFGIPNNDGESDIIAAVVPIDPSSFVRDELLRYCKAEMAEYLIPKDILVMDAFPQTSSGKPDRVQIREGYIRSSPQKQR